MRRGKKEVGCPVETTLRVIEGRWKVIVLHYLLPGTKRFYELQRLLKSISHRTLAQQLRELEGDGILRRKVYPQIPPKVESSLTRLGASLGSSADFVGDGTGAPPQTPGFCEA